MDFVFTMGGYLSLDGFAVTSKMVRLPFAFKEGDTPYLRYRAQQGVLQQIAVRQVRMDVYDKTYGISLQTYYDQSNFRYNESELASSSEAVSLAAAYYRTAFYRSAYSNKSLNGR